MDKLTINHIASVLVEKNGIAPKDAEQFVAAMFDVIQEGLENDKQVKVRGLGTFKIVDVEPRESVNVNTGERVLIKGHSKISFTPDASMKEMVNKPFSQFDTVVLNDGVEFPETSAETSAETDAETSAETDAEISVETEPAEEPAHTAMAASEPVVDEVSEVEEQQEPIADESIYVESVQQDQTAIADKELSDKELDDNRLTDKKLDSAVQEEENEEEPQEDTSMETADGHNNSKTIWWVLLVIVLVGGSGYGGYWLASSGQSASVSEAEVPESETPRINTSLTESMAKKTPAPTSKEVKPTVQDTVKPSAPTPSARLETDIQKVAAKYDALDSRVRTGAYCIVGEETTVKVKTGETMKIIAKRALGPGMECYVEVFNNLSANAVLTEGQTIKIPKLELRKRVFNKKQE